jgi:CBS domain-containing protein
MNVGEFCTREVVIIDRDGTILEAARLMRRHHVGDVVVIEQRGNDNLPVGILTDRDVVVKLVAEGIDLARICVGEAMSFDLHVVNEQDGLFETIQFMRRRGVRRVPVVDSVGGLVGIVTLDDMIEVVAEQLGELVRLFGRNTSWSANGGKNTTEVCHQTSGDVILATAVHRQ